MKTKAGQPAEEPKTETPAAPAAEAPAAEPAEEREITDADVLVHDAGHIQELQDSPIGGEEGETEDAPTGSATEAAGAAPATSPAAAAPAAPKPDEAREWRVGNKVFKSAEELAAYVTGSAETQEAITNASAKPKEDEPAKPKFEDVIYEDPAKAKQILLDELREEQRLEKEKNDRIKLAEQRRQDAWKRFYNDNPDLVGFEEEVQSVVSVVAREHGDNLKMDKALPLIAQAARGKLNKLKEKLAPAKELPNKDATTHVGGAEVPRAAPKAQVTGFLDQVKQFQRRGERAV